MPFREGTKRFRIAEGILVGDRDEKIVEELKLKGKPEIYRVRSLWKKRRAFEALKALKAAGQRTPKMPQTTIPSDENLRVS